MYVCVCVKGVPVQVCVCVCFNCPFRLGKTSWGYRFYMLRPQGWDLGEAAELVSDGWSPRQADDTEAQK